MLLITMSNKHITNLLILLFVLLLIMFSFNRGLHEGIIMLQNTDSMHTGELDGFKGHVNYNLYHVINITPYIIFAGCVLMWIKLKNNLRWFHYIVLALLTWESFDMGYTFARTGNFISTYEHINFMEFIDFRIDGTILYILHMLRISSIILFKWR